MFFIGIIADNKSFDNIKTKILENITNPRINILNINSQSIRNLKNVKFETIIIDNGIEKLKNYTETLEYILKNSKYLVLNTDINLELLVKNECDTKIISYGLNHKAIITVSSITDTNILIYLQKNIINNNNEKIEVGENSVRLTDKNNLKTYEILALYAILLIYNQKIIDEI